MANFSILVRIKKQTKILIEKIFRGAEHITQTQYSPKIIIIKKQRGEMSSLNIMFSTCAIATQF